MPEPGQGQVVATEPIDPQRIIDFCYTYLRKHEPTFTPTADLGERQKKIDAFVGYSALGAMVDTMIEDLGLVRQTGPSGVASDQVDRYFEGGEPR